MNGVLGHLCTQVAKLGQENLLAANGEMNEMTLPSRHRISTSTAMTTRRVDLGFCLV